MSADDETPVTPDDEDDSDAPDGGEHLPPSTWAGRQRAEGADAPKAETSGEPDDEEIAEAPEEEEVAEAPDEEDVAEGPTEDIADEPQAEAEDHEADEDGEDAGEEEEGAGGEEEEVADGEQEGEQEEGEDGDEDADEDEGADEDADDDGDDDEEPAADSEQFQEAAIAGLRARTAEHAEKAGAATPTPVEAARASAAAIAADEDAAEGKPPRAKPLWARFLAASLVIVISMAAATSISLLLYLTDIAEGLNDNDALAGLREQLIEADGGDPQTILIIGSDKRLGPEGQGDPGRSDTTILLRVDPDKDAIALLSIPRDLKVNIPGYGVAKFNEAYTVGQEDKTLKTVKQLHRHRGQPRRQHQLHGVR